MADPRVAKIQALIDNGATEGEREAAREAMKRLRASGVNTDAQQPPPSPRTPWDDLFRQMPRDPDIAAFLNDLFGKERAHQERMRQEHENVSRSSRDQYYDQQILAVRHRIEFHEREARVAEKELELLRLQRERDAAQPSGPQTSSASWLGGARISDDPRHHDRVWFEKD